MGKVSKSILVMGTALAAVAMLGQGCAQQPAAPEPQQPQFRHSVETAPADLQLVCAGEAAHTFEVAPDRVLPIASYVEGEDTFVVVLNAGGTRAICTIDDEGEVLSLLEA